MRVKDISIEVRGETAHELSANGILYGRKYGTVATIKLPMTVDGLSVQTKPKEAPKLTPKEAEKLAKESYAAEMKAKGKGSLPKGF